MLLSHLARQFIRLLPRHKSNRKETKRKHTLYFVVKTTHEKYTCTHIHSEYRDGERKNDALCAYKTKRQAIEHNVYLTTTELKSKMNKFIATLLFLRSLCDRIRTGTRVATHSIPFAVEWSNGLGKAKHKHYNNKLTIEIERITKNH